MKGAQTIEATSVKQLENAGVRIGDTLRLTGTGCVIFARRAVGMRAHHAVYAFRLLADCLERRPSSAAAGI
ncbi:IgaA/UmoB family intracellular growth attenuator [Acinetobacter baumannii]|uniref:IgaA/UmoB family intracellular growth attenuator n=1 Tax=Acinetobacter baumannii TaxID=470 RepID=UPI003D2FDA6F